MVQQFGAVNNLRNMVNILREVSFDDVRDDALRVPSVVVVGPTPSDAQSLAEALFGTADSVKTADFSIPVSELDQHEAIVVSDPDGQGGASQFNERLRSLPEAPPILRLAGYPQHQQTRIEEARADLMRRLPERTPAFGRAFPAMRAAASKAVIDETAVANAQFALVSNIPAIIPVIGSLAAAGADFIVLTKNQVMMIYKLAAIAGRDLEDQIGIIQEIVPVVGIGFAWRTLARGAASLVPFAAGTLPKVAIAFAGTVAVGRGAEFYYRTNVRPTRTQLQRYLRQALDLLSRLPQLVANRTRDNGEENGRTSE